MVSFLEYTTLTFCLTLGVHSKNTHWPATFEQRPTLLQKLFYTNDERRFLRLKNNDCPYLFDNSKYDKLRCL